MILSILIVLAILAGLVITFIPAIVAYRGDHPHALFVLLICLFCGWTVIGWIVALIWAAVGRPAPRPQAYFPRMVRRDDGEAVYQRILEEEMRKGQEK